MTPVVFPIIVERPNAKWNRQASHVHFRKLGELLVQQRKVYGSGCVLVDLHTAVIQDDSALSYVQSDLQSILAGGDKIAFVGGSAPMHRQKARLVVQAQVRMFEREDEARLWLLNKNDEVEENVGESNQVLRPSLTRVERIEQSQSDLDGLFSALSQGPNGPANLDLFATWRKLDAVLSDIRAIAQNLEDDPHL